MSYNTMSRRTAIAALIAGSLAGCGGGGGGHDATASHTGGAMCRQPRTFSCWGDSIQAGSYAIAPDSDTTGYLNPRPTERIADVLGCSAHGIFHHLPGSLTQHLSVWRSAVERDPAPVQVLRFGGADALAGTPPERFRDALDQVIQISRAQVKRVLLVGVIHVAPSKRRWGWTDDMLRELDVRASATNAAIGELATRHGVPMVDLRRSVRFDGPDDIADLVHPGQTYSDRCAIAIAAAAGPLFETPA